MTKRRDVLKHAGAASALTATGFLAGCSSGGGGDDGNGTTVGDPDETVSLKIGGLLPLTGPYAKAGVTQRLGMKLGKQRVEEEIDGAEVELVYKDTELTPDVGLRRARELVNRENVDAMVGPTSSAASRAILPLVEQEQIPVLNSGSAAVDLTGERCNPYYFRFSSMALQNGYTQLQWASENLGDTYAFIGANYAFPQSAHDALNDFKDQFDTSEATAVWPSLGASDYSTEVQKLADADADYIIGRLGGTDAANFIRQADSFGLFEDKPLVGVSLWEAIAATGEATIGTFATMPFIWEMQEESDNVAQYVSDFKDTSENIKFPEMRTMAATLGITATARAATEAGSAGADAMAEQLEGQEGSFPVPYKLRACDHQASYEQIAYEVVESDEYDHPVRTINARVPQGEDLPGCGEIPCDGPFY